MASTRPLGQPTRIPKTCPAFFLTTRAFSLRRDCTKHFFLPSHRNTEWDLVEGNSPGLKLSTSLVPYYSTVSTFQVRPANLQPLIITPLCGARESLKDSVAAWVNYTLVAVHGKFLFNPNYWCNVCGQLRPPFLPTIKWNSKIKSQLLPNHPVSRVQRCLL